MTVCQIENGLMRQLFGVVSTGSSLEDNHVIRINDVEVANSTLGDPMNVSFDELGKLLIVFAEFGPAKN